jgi:hypothetical protein
VRGAGAVSSGSDVFSIDSGGKGGHGLELNLLPHIAVFFPLQIDLPDVVDSLLTNSWQ